MDYKCDKKFKKWITKSNGITKCDGFQSDRYSTVPVTILKQSLVIYLPYLIQSINYTINEGKFLAELGHSEVIPLFGKEDKLKKTTIDQ